MARCRRHGGFALVETLVALMLLAVGGAGLVAGWALGLRAQEAALAGRAALQATADLAEGLRAVPAVARDGVAGAWQDVLHAPAAHRLSRRLHAVTAASASRSASGWQALVTWQDRLGDEQRLRVAIGVAP